MIQIDSEESYTQLVEQYADMLFQIAYHNLLHTADSEDAVQETFYQLLKSRPVFESQQHLKAWLIRTVIHRCYDIRKRLFRLREVPLMEYDKSFTQEDEYVIYELAKLKPKERNIIYLHYYEGYTIAEIAEVLKLKPNTAGSLLRRGRKKLKTILEEGDL